MTNWKIFQGNRESHDGIKRLPLPPNLPRFSADDDICERGKYSGNDITYLNDKNIPADDIALGLIADQILNKTPKQGYLTISNA